MRGSLSGIVIKLDGIEVSQNGRNYVKFTLKGNEKGEDFLIDCLLFDKEAERFARTIEIGVLLICSGSYGKDGMFFASTFLAPNLIKSKEKERAKNVARPSPVRFEIEDYIDTLGIDYVNAQIREFLKNTRSNAPENTPGLTRALRGFNVEAFRALLRKLKKEAEIVRGGSN